MSSDQELISSFLSLRNERAFKALYSAHTPRLYAIALRLTRLPEDAEELIQEMWVKAIQKLPDFQGRSTLRTWLTGILINLNKEHWRKAAKEKKTMELDAQTRETTTSQRIGAMDLEEAIRLLPDGYKQVLILHDVEGYKHKEIAEMLDISDGTSKSQLFQARKALRTYLSENSKNEQI